MSTFGERLQASREAAAQAAAAKQEHTVALREARLQFLQPVLTALQEMASAGVRLDGRRVTWPGEDAVAAIRRTFTLSIRLSARKHAQIGVYPLKATPPFTFVYVADVLPEDGFNRSTEHLYTDDVNAMHKWLADVISKYETAAASHDADLARLQRQPQPPVMIEPATLDGRTRRIELE